MEFINFDEHGRWIHAVFANNPWGNPQTNRKMPREPIAEIKSETKKGGAKMGTGVVKFFTERGYGFITGDDEKEYFVHHTGINADGFRSLDAGQRVSFDVEPSDRGPKAVNVTVIIEGSSE